MPFHVTLKRSSHFVRYIAAGTASLRRFLQLVDLVSAEPDDYEDDLVLLDLRKVQGQLGESESLRLGEIAGLKLPFVFKLACLGRPGLLPAAFEHAARLQGLHVLTFCSQDAALAWLMSEAATGSTIAPS